MESQKKNGAARLKPSRWFINLVFKLVECLDDGFEVWNLLEDHFVYRQGALSEIDGTEVAGKINLLSAGFTLDYHVNDNVGLRVSYHALGGGGTDIDGDMFRLKVNFGWNALVEKIGKLGGTLAYLSIPTILG